MNQYTLVNLDCSIHSKLLGVMRYSIFISLDEHYSEA